ncbi:MAG: 3-deoxy-D-manno-octulosonic acid transferase [Rhodospirillaceae bacterium]|nr:3-deoxy-D-manno-octulosonic acid transferase [Rhodospirillaceae bacterium]OUT76134.1 MAG: hypothetical protein CBB83_11400 [Rhodospirillaceae bacterium TMED23]|tara:strand:- start:7025 stop:8302 length:1278 start_codon:yes stop_codon:yes gene_type:complete
MLLKIYRAITVLGTPIISMYLYYRKSIGKEDRDRHEERIGISRIPKPNGFLFWIHAASIGESLSVITLIENLLKSYPNSYLMITTGTITSAKILKDRLPDRAFHQYIPVDKPSYVSRFIEHWRPDVALWTESEFWPNIIFKTHKSEIPLLLLNGRISDKSYAKWQIAPSLMKNILSCFNLCLGQSEEDVIRLRKLGAPKVKNLGNLKFSVPPLPVDLKSLGVLQSQIINRPLWLATSTHYLEENMVTDIHKKLKNIHKDILTIIVPRQVNRGEKIARLLKNKNISFALRSLDNPITPDTQIYVADTMGELGLFFSLSDIVLMGKSLVPYGGQNPIEPLKFGCAVIHGPHMTNFRWICKEMKKHGCSVEVKTTLECSESISKLINKISDRKKMIQKGNKFIDSQSEVVSLVIGEILTILDSKYAPT